MFLLTVTKHSQMTIKPEVLEPRVPYSIHCEVDNVKDKIKGSASMGVSINKPPFGGSCGTEVFESVYQVLTIF